MPERSPHDKLGGSGHRETAGSPHPAPGLLVAMRSRTERIAPVRAAGETPDAPRRAIPVDLGPRIAEKRVMRLHVTIDGETYSIELRDGAASALVQGPGSEPSERHGLCAGPSGGIEARRLRPDETREEAVRISARLFSRSGGTVRVLLEDGRVLEATVESDRDRIRARATRRGVSAERSSVLRSAIPGVVRRLLCQVGDLVEANTALVTLEAMKMENEIRTEIAGRVSELYCAEGDSVAANAPLLTVVAVPVPELTAPGGAPCDGPPPGA